MNQASTYTKGAEIPLTQGKVAIVDRDVYEALSQHKWLARRKGQLWYAQRSIPKPGGGQRIQLMHAAISGFPLTDHINGNGLDNRRVNLRRATYSQNAFNMRKHKGTSRFKGVSLHRQAQKWVAAISFAGKRTHLGLFSDETAAAQQYDAAARELFGTYAALNFPGPGERSALIGAVA